MTHSSADSIGRRLFGHRRIHRVTERRLDQAINHLVERVRLTYPQVALVVGVARGGIRPSRTLAERLRVPSIPVFARHNTSEDTHLPASGDVMIDLADLPERLANVPEGTAILLVDDICGSGATLRVLRRALSPHLGEGTLLVDVVLCRNVGSDHVPDLTVWDVDDWVLFPWEADPTSSLPVVELPVPAERRS